jgi:hypothetical protein
VAALSIQDAIPPILTARTPQTELAESKDEDSSCPAADLELVIAPNSWITGIDSPTHHQQQGQGQQQQLLPSILHYFSPFDIFTKDTCCWYGKLDRYLKKKQIWKTANFIIYCDRICLIPLDSKKRRRRSIPGGGAAAGGGGGGHDDGMKRMKYFLFSECTEVTMGTLQYRDCIQLHGLGKKKRLEEKTKLVNMKNAVLGAIPSLFSSSRDDDVESFAIRNQSRTQSIRDLGVLFERESFVNMNAIKQVELLELFQQCRLWGRRQKLYQLTYQLFEKEEEGKKIATTTGAGAVMTNATTTPRTLGFKKSSSSSSSSSSPAAHSIGTNLNSLIEFFNDPKLSRDQVEQILTSPVDESDGMSYLHKLASYPYHVSVEITKYLLEKYYHTIPAISPLELCCHQQVDALHIAIRCHHEEMIRYYLGHHQDQHHQQLSSASPPPSPCAQEFQNSQFFLELSIQSYLCYTTTPTMFDLISAYSPSKNLLRILDSQENTLLMLLLSRGSIAVVLHLLQTIPSRELFSDTTSHASDDGDHTGTDPSDGTNTRGSTDAMSQQNLANYLNIQNWKHQNCLSLTLSLFSFYSNILTQSLCADIQKIILLLLENGCNPNLCDLNGNTSIHLISSLILSLLVSNNSQHLIGYQMKLKTYVEILKLFVCHSRPPGDLFALNNKGETGLSIISQMTDYSLPEDTLREIVDTLIGITQDGGSPRRQQQQSQQSSDYGRTRSYSGSEMGSHLSKQLSIVNHSFGSRTLFHSVHSPLHLCAHNGHVRLLAHLINRGGDIHRQNHHGEKPIDVVMKRQQMIQTLPPSPSVALLQHGLDACFTLLMEQRGNAKYHLERRKSAWNLKSHSSNDVIYGRHKDGHYEIQSGLVSALVPLLCQDKYSANEDDIRAVASSYHLVDYDHVDILRLVLGVVHDQIRQSQAPPALETSPTTGETGEQEDEEEELDFTGVLSFLVIWFSWRRNELGNLPPPLLFSTHLSLPHTHRIFATW